MNMETSAAVAARTRGSPFGNLPLKPKTVEPAPKKIQEIPIVVPFVEPAAEVLSCLKLFDPNEFVTADYYRAWQKTELLCAKVPLVHRKGPAAIQSLILIQMQDTLGTAARVRQWLSTLAGERVFEHHDEPVDTFLALLRTAQSFTAGPTQGTPIAVFFYPTNQVLEELTQQQKMRGVRVVVVLDNVYCAAVRTLRQAPNTTILYVDPLPKAVVHDCYNYLRTAWRLPNIRQEYLLARAGDDPRALLHMMYFERLRRDQPSVAWGGHVDWDWHQWVHFWNNFGAQTLYEWLCDKPVGNGPGIISRQSLGTGQMAVVAWDYAKLPAVSRTEIPICTNLDVDMSLACLHYSAPKALMEARVDWTDACAATMDLLSSADLQQNRFSPHVSPLHQEAVRYGIYQASGKIPARVEGHKLPLKDFYAWLAVQRNRKQTVNKAFVVCEFAPLVLVHKTESLARLLFLAGPSAYWPTRILPSVQDYAANAAESTQQMTVHQEIAWRLVWRHVEEHAKTTGNLPVRPDHLTYRVPPEPPAAASCKHGTPSYEMCGVCFAYVPGNGTMPLAPCKHGGTAFAWCRVCGAAPSEPFLRCQSFCKGWGSCYTCASYNRLIALVVMQARTMEKI